MTVLIVRPAHASSDDACALRDRGFEVMVDPYLTVSPCSDMHAGDRARRLLVALAGRADWFIVTSVAGPRALVSLLGEAAVRDALIAGARRGTRFAAVGPASAQSLRSLGASAVTIPDAQHTATGLLAALEHEPAAQAALARSSIADQLLPATLAARGWTLTQEVVYDTTTVAVEPGSAAGLRAGEFAAVVLRSPSAVRAVTAWAKQVHPRTAVVAGGPTTALAAARSGLRVSIVATGSSSDQIAAAVAAVTH